MGQTATLFMFKATFAVVLAAGSLAPFGARLAMDGSQI
jgi:hypothetical protein